MRVKTPRKYRIQKKMLVPAQWQGSVEHFYHFMLGYFVPVTLWQMQTQTLDFAVRDCGPMNPWFELLEPGSSIEYVKPGVMLQRTLTHRQEMQVFWDWDNPTRFHRKSLAKCRALIKHRTNVEDTRHSAPSPLRITVLNRKVSSDFYHGEKTEVVGSGSQIRSIPNLLELSELIHDFGVVTFVDSAELTPEQQVQLFSRTDLLIAQHGAGLSNMLWMNPLTTVVEIQPPLPPTIDKIFENLAWALNVKYICVKQRDEHADIDVSEVARIISKASLGVEGKIPNSPTRFPLSLLRALPRTW